MYLFIILLIIFSYYRCTPLWLYAVVLVGTLISSALYLLLFDSLCILLRLVLLETDLCEEVLDGRLGHVSDIEFLLEKVEQVLVHKALVILVLRLLEDTGCCTQGQSLLHLGFLLLLVLYQFFGGLSAQLVFAQTSDFEENFFEL